MAIRFFAIDVVFERERERERERMEKQLWAQLWILLHVYTSDEEYVREMV